ncbi:flagellar filament capping protein FliD [Piscinibacter sakaiensis]|uniref:flagellar filament capping protein FliD n=1 Tax=Piscinibacter sakaiensis TaxID=1547922 RepID=UPI003AAB9139
MAISSPGIGSGLDVQGIVSQLISLEQRPLTQLKTKQVTLNSQLSSFGQIKGKIAALQDAAAAMAKPEAWSRTASTSSDVSSVSVTSSGTAASGSYAVSVSQLAKAHNIASASFSGGSSTVVGAGRLRIETGSWTDQNNDPANPAWLFAAKDGATPFDIEIPEGKDTLAGIRDQINAAKAGVTASIVNDGTGARLVVRSDLTGAENALKITEIDVDGNPASGNLAALTYDRAAPAPTPPQTAMLQTVPPQEAKATINGIDLVSSTNTFKDVGDGLSFTALKTTTAEVTLSVSTDTTFFKNAVNKFVAMYNDVNATLRELTKYDDASKSGGILQGDRTALTIQSQLRALVGGTAGTSSSFKRLSDFGISLDRDGRLNIDDTKLTAAMANPSEVALAMTSKADAAPGERGIAALFESFTKAVTGSDGTLTSRTDSLSQRVKLNGKEQERVNARIEQTRTRLLAQYSALDTKLSTLTGLNSYVSQQIATWNKSTS